MKKWKSFKSCMLAMIITAIMGSLLTLASGNLALAATHIKLLINGSPAHSDIPLQLVNGHVMVPISAIAKQLGLTATWNNDTKQLSISSKPAANTGTAPEPMTENPAKPGISKPVYLYLVRHGKTMFNTTGQVQGWSDTPLTDAGVAGAKALAVGLKDIPFITAYSSDLGRARSTAKYILEAGDRKGLALTELSGLREWNYGGYEGKTNKEMWDPIFESQGLTFDEKWSQYGALTAKLSDEEISNLIAKNDPIQTAENYSQIVERTRQAIQQIVAETSKTGGGNALVVSHGSEILTILDLFVPGQTKGTGISNCSVTIIKVENGHYSLEAVGDTSYLKKGEEALKQK